MYQKRQSCLLKFRGVKMQHWLHHQKVQFNVASLLSKEQRQHSFGCVTQTFLWLAFKKKKKNSEEHIWPFKTIHVGKQITVLVHGSQSAWRHYWMSWRNVCLNGLLVSRCTVGGRGWRWPSFIYCLIVMATPFLTQALLLSRESMKRATSPLPTLLPLSGTKYPSWVRNSWAGERTKVNRSSMYTQYSEECSGNSESIRISADGDVMAFIHTNAAWTMSEFVPGGIQHFVRWIKRCCLPCSHTDSQDNDGINTDIHVLPACVLQCTVNATWIIKRKDTASAPTPGLVMHLGGRDHLIT